ncbi:hypothetical protein QN362_01205 [Actimicrobium sp. CCC2.4]|uniref:hypothetical protein n=1 Tax=Actimicrobium sp. CCC2.4 TaxID=3048606 RepID=UPI002AC9C62B|nr:hypothetical protein [Actimicrobium sp. CCC2.4]MEB0133941.1 hypothetical protein [Actimicrobium sp. CCC2.4]WPX31481.1 hypothetical protein RHM62_14685 [Actimicrobium sp. CCC2.4]
MTIKTCILLASLSTIAMTGNNACADGIPLQPAWALSGPVATPGTKKSAAVTARANARAEAAANSSSSGGAAQGVGSQGQSLSIDSHARYEAQARSPVATAMAPALTSSNDTCMGSTSVGASAVSFGFSVGSSWTDSNCLMLKNAREIWNMGFKGAALARLCMDKLNREAFEVTGVHCPDREAATLPGNPTAGLHGADANYRY